MTCCVGRVTSRQIRPWRSSAQNPKNTVQNITGVSPRPATLLGRPGTLWARYKFLDRLPLFVGEVHLRLQTFSSPDGKVVPKDGAISITCASESWFGL